MSMPSTTKKLGKTKQPLRKQRRQTVPNLPRNDTPSELFPQTAPALPNAPASMPPASSASVNKTYEVPCIENAPQKHAPHMVDDPLNNWRQRRAYLPLR